MLESKTIIDLNIESIEEIAQRQGYQSLTAARKKIEKLESLGLLTIISKIPVNKVFNAEDIINGNTGYPSIDKIVGDLKNQEANSTSSLLKLLNKDAFDTLACLYSKFLPENHFEKQTENFKKCLFKQWNLICSFFIYKTTEKLPEAVNPDMVTAFEVEFINEYQRRSKSQA